MGMKILSKRILAGIPSHDEQSQADPGVYELDGKWHADLTHPSYADEKTALKELEQSCAKLSQLITSNRRDVPVAELHQLRQQCEKSLKEVLGWTHNYLS